MTYSITLFDKEIGEIMDRRKSILNVTVSTAFRIITMILAIVVKKFLIDYCGNEVNGLNALYLSIIGFLSVAELGVGSAITFCMYKPVVEKDYNKLSALYHLFKRLYLIIGSIILLVGIIITPFIKHFAKDYKQLDVNLYLTFVLMLISVVITYLLGAKTALINAYKNDYITTSISSGGIVLQNILQIVMLVITHSFVAYLICRIVAATAQCLATDFIARRKYNPIIKKHAKIDGQTRLELIRNIKAMFMHKVGTLLVNTVDSVIISVFIGVIVLGKYSNYTMISFSLASILKLVFTSMTSVLGHLYVEENKATTQKYCEAFHILNFLMASFFFLGYYAIVDSLISILFSHDLVVAKSISFVITLNEFVQFMRQSTMTFRDATGTFYNDRWKPLLEGIVNIILSILFVKIIGVVGVIVATIITNLVICHIVEPYVLYKNAFEVSPKKHYIRNYGMIILFALALILLNFVMKSYDNQWLQLLVNGCISVVVSVCVCAIELLLNKNICKHFIALYRKGRGNS